MFYGMIRLHLLNMGIDLLQLSEISDIIVYLVSSARSQEAVTLPKSDEEKYFFSVQ